MKKYIFLYIVLAYCNVFAQENTSNINNVGFSLVPTDQAKMLKNHLDETQSPINIPTISEEELKKMSRQYAPLSNKKDNEDDFFDKLEIENDTSEYEDFVLSQSSKMVLQLKVSIPLNKDNKISKDIDSIIPFELHKILVSHKDDKAIEKSLESIFKVLKISGVKSVLNVFAVDQYNKTTAFYTSSKKDSFRFDTNSYVHIYEIGVKKNNAGSVKWNVLTQNFSAMPEWAREIYSDKFKQENLEAMTSVFMEMHKYQEKEQGIITGGKHYYAPIQR